jgi:DNA-binding response OmpR family regulator
MDQIRPIVSAATRRVSILVVDDEPLILTTLQRALADDSHDVVPAASAAQAQTLLRQRCFDAMVLDVHLDSDPDGLRFLEMLKKDPATSGLPVIMVTGDRREDILPAARAKGAADCLRKPLRLDLLKAKLDRLVREARQAPATAQCSRNGALVLHAEDDDEWADLVRGWLAGTGFALHRVASRRDLLRFLGSCRKLPACILLDLGLRDADGLGVCDELKADVRWRKIPILLLTNLEGQRLAGLRHRAFNLVSKQSETAGQELVDALRAVLPQEEVCDGVVELGDIRLDPIGPSVYRNGKLLCTPDEGAFAALRLLMERSPNPVPDAGLRQAFLRRRDCRDHDSSRPQPLTVKVYVSHLRCILGDEVGSRITRSHKLGYQYISPVVDGR